MQTKILKKGETLSYLAGINRPIDPAQVTKLATSINKMGVIRPIVAAWITFLTGKPILYIIDGQHLFNALMRNNLPIEYVLIDIKDQKDLVEKIALLNSSSKSWKLVDYITAWGSVSNEYKALQKYYHIYDFELTTLASVLMNRTAGNEGGGSVSIKIKRGEFVMVSETRNVQILNYLTDVLKVVSRMNRRENKYLCEEYVNFLRTSFDPYDHETFINNLKANKSKFILATQEPGKLVQMFRKLST